jgi:hypothetical protein
MVLLLDKYTDRIQVGSCSWTTQRTENTILLPNTTLTEYKIVLLLENYTEKNR